MEFHRDLFGFVQAGGSSQRFGADKALAVIGGETMLARTTALVWSACGNVRIVAAQGKYAHAPAEIIEDRWPGQGPLGGILTALTETCRNADRAWNLIVGCDMPFLTSEWLQYLCDRAVASQAEVVFPESQFGWEPLCACWSTKALPELQGAFEGGVRKVTEAMKRIRSEVLDASAWKRFDTGGRLFWNMNTQADFAEAQRIIESNPDEQ
jgi:molybdopterin-guanine dinucleotide biosynthesis protein A